MVSPSFFFTARSKVRENGSTTDEAELFSLLLRGFPEGQKVG